MWTNIKNHAKRLLIILCIICALIFAAFFYPLKQSHAAALNGFGGRVIATQPCLYPPGAFLVTLALVLAPKSAVTSPFMIWLPPPGTITNLKGPPLTPGQWVLGTFLSPAACVTAWWPYTWIGGTIISIVGTGIPGGGGTAP